MSLIFIQILHQHKIGYQGTERAQAGVFNQWIKLQIIISLQMAALQKHKEQNKGKKRGEVLVGVQRQEEIWTICARP